MIELIKHTNRYHIQWLKEPETNLLQLPFKKASYDISWKRDDFVDFDRSFPVYLHRFDKNSSYLAACTGVAVGVGEPVHITDDIELSYPGIYRVSYEVGSSRFDGVSLPRCFRDKQLWATSDQITRARKLGYVVTVSEGYQWHEKHRVLEDFATFVWNAREGYHPLRGDTKRFPHPACRAHAYHFTKSLALHLGRLASSKYEEFRRPDYYSSVVGRARETVLYMLDNLVTQGHTPVLVYADAIYLPSYEKDRRKAFPTLVEKETKLGGYKYEGFYEVEDELLELWRTEKPGIIVTFLKHRGC